MASRFALPRTAAIAVLAIASAACSGGPVTDCQTDLDCSSGQVCARDGECLAPSQVRSVKVTWTVRGMAASATTCATIPDLFVQFANGAVYRDTFGFEPVPCDAGQFPIDKLPVRFDQVEVGVDGLFSNLAYIDDATGTAMIDLQP